MFGLVVKVSVPYSGVPGFNSWLTLACNLQLSANRNPGWQQVMVQVIGSPLPMWDIWIKFSGFWLQPWPLWALGKWTSGYNLSYLFLSHPASQKQTNKKNICKTLHIQNIWKATHKKINTGPYLNRELKGWERKGYFKTQTFVPFECHNQCMFY